MYMYSTVQMQGITNARLRSRATAFVSACERVRLRVRTRSHADSLLLTNAFTSTHECPNERKRKRLFRWRLTVASIRLLHRANAFVWTAQTRFVERANAFVILCI